MTAPTINRNAAKKPLISGCRPDMTGPGGAREAPRAARSEAPKSLFEAVEKGAGVLLGHSVHVV